MNIKALVAEFIGTFALIFVGICVIANLGAARDNLGLVGIALGHGLALVCLITATGAISGGHLNPAVTIALWIGKKIDLLNSAGYVVAQILGAISAAACAQFVLPGGAAIAVVNGTPAVSELSTQIQAIVAEAIATFFLVFTVYGSAVDRRAPKAGGLFIGLSVTMGILAIGPISGAAMNPARYLGPALLTGHTKDAVVWIAGPLVGGALAGLVYAHFLEKPDAAPA